MSRPSSYSPEIRERAVRMVAESKADYGSEFEAIKSIASKLGIGSAETLRKWVRRAEIDAGQRPGVTTEESEQLKALKRENAELQRANEILKSAATAVWLAFSTTPLRLPCRGGQIATEIPKCLATAANDAVTRPDAGWQTVAIRSNRHTRVNPLSARVTRSSASMRCG